MLRIQSFFGPADNNISSAPIHIPRLQSLSLQHRSSILLTTEHTENREMAPVNKAYSQPRQSDRCNLLVDFLESVEKHTNFWSSHVHVSRGNVNLGPDVWRKSHAEFLQDALFVCRAGSLDVNFRATWGMENICKAKNNETSSKFLPTANQMMSTAY